MKDYFHKFLKWISYNRGKVLGIALALTIAVVIFGCQIKTASLVDPGREVTQDQYHQEYNLLASDIERRYLILEKDATELVANYELGAADLDKQIEQRKQWVDLASGVVTTALAGNPVAWADVVTTGGFLLLGGLTAGSVYDQRKKDGVIKIQKNLLNGGPLVGGAKAA